MLDFITREKKDVDKTKRDDDTRVQLEKQGVLKNYAVIFASIVVILAGIHATRGILGPIFLAVFFAVLLISPIKWLRSKGIAASLALSGVILAVIAVCLLVTTLVATQLAQFAGNIPEYRDSFNEVLSNYNLGFKVDAFLPGFLKSKDKDKGDNTKEKNEDKSDENSANVSHANPNKQGDKRDDSERLGTNLLVSSTFPRVTDSTMIGDSNDVETSGDNVEENKAFFETSVNEDSIIPDNPKNDLIEETPQDSEGLRLQNPPSVRELLIKEDEEIGSNGVIAAVEDEDKEKESEVSGKEEDEHSLTTVSAADAVDASSEELFRFMRGLTAELSYLGSDAFLITLMLIFMLCETANIPKKLVAVWGEKKFTNSHIEKVLEDIRRYMVIKTWMSVFVGTFVTILLIVSKVQYPLLWGFVAFLLNYIPNIGSVVAAIPPIVLATIEHGMVVGGIDAIFFVIINCGIGYGLEPRLLGDGLNLSPLVVLLALIFFGWLLGPVGMFLSPPLAVIMKIIFQAFPETYWLAALMANKPTTRALEDLQESA